MAALLVVIAAKLKDGSPYNLVILDRLSIGAILLILKMAVKDPAV